MNIRFIVGLAIGSAATIITYELYSKVLCRTVPIDAKPLPDVQEETTEPVETEPDVGYIPTKEDIERNTIEIGRYSGAYEYPRDDIGEIEMINQEEYDHKTYPYDQIELYLYDDGIVATEEDEIVHALDLIGAEALAEIKAMNEGSIFVRNPRMSSEYAVTRVHARYTDVTGEVLTPFPGD